jgi:Uncharacterized conserved protein
MGNGMNFLNENKQLWRRCLSERIHLTGGQPNQALFLVSACLCGLACRYDGQAKPVGRLAEFHQMGFVMAVCPEVEGGLSTPRPPCELFLGKVVSRDGLNLTDAFQCGAERALDLARKNSLRLAVLKDNSPSCGSTTVYDGSFKGRLIPGQGLTTVLLREHGLLVISDRQYLTLEKEIITSLSLRS